MDTKRQFLQIFEFMWQEALGATSLGDTALFSTGVPVVVVLSSALAEFPCSCHAVCMASPMVLSRSTAC